MNDYFIFIIHFRPGRGASVVTAYSSAAALVIVSIMSIMAKKVVIIIVSIMSKECDGKNSEGDKLSDEGI